MQSDTITLWSEGHHSHRSSIRSASDRIFLKSKYRSLAPSPPHNLECTHVRPAVRVQLGRQNGKMDGSHGRHQQTGHSTDRLSMWRRRYAHPTICYCPFTTAIAAEGNEILGIDPANVHSGKRHRQLVCDSSVRAMFFVLVPILPVPVHSIRSRSWALPCRISPYYKH